MIAFAMAKFALALALTLIASGPAFARGLDDAGAAMIAAQHGDYDQAIRLLTSALAAGDLSPANTMLAYHNRGNAYQDKGDYARAIADYETAIRLKPDYANAWYARGRAQFALGRFPAAATDFAKSATLDPKDAYAMIWLHLTRRRTAADDGGELARNAARLDLARWPGAVINLYLGKGTPQQARAAVAKDNEEQACEAAFYLGEYELMRKNTAAAKTLLQEAAKICPPPTDERDGAGVELKRL
jgi:lipoprotein NlpI